MEPLTILSGEDYVLKEGITTAEAVARLGAIETLFTSGELMLPDVKIGDEVFIIYKNAQVLSVYVESIFTQYDEITEKHIYHLLLRNQYDAEQEIDVPTTNPGAVIFNEITSIEYNGTTYTADDSVADLSEGARAAIRNLMKFVYQNVVSELYPAGKYTNSNPDDPTQWIKIPDESKIIQYIGVTRPNRRYCMTTDNNFTVTFPTDFDTTADCTITIQLKCTAESDISFPSGTLFYGGNTPDIIVGSNLIIMDYNAAAGTWCVGVLNAEVAS